MPTTYDGQVTRTTPHASSVTGDTGIGRAETPVERRLREMAQWSGFTTDRQVLDAGREAIRLLRLLLPGVAIGEVCLSEYCQCGTLRAIREAQALLARCEGDR